MARLAVAFGVGTRRRFRPLPGPGDPKSSPPPVPKGDRCRHSTSSDETDSKSSPVIGFLSSDCYQSTQPRSRPQTCPKHGRDARVVFIRGCPLQAPTFPHTLSAFLALTTILWCAHTFSAGGSGLTVPVFPTGRQRGGVYWWCLLVRFRLQRLDIGVVGGRRSVRE